ncbi:MAG: 50S ribosomal protein L22 [Alphaproteobacteria bacterium]|nr:50S ribosomal protein L22 [Alphaproteobacteria bacterium]
MSKPSRPRSLKDTEARAILRSIRISPRKLNLVAESIRGKSAQIALAELAFSKVRIAGTVRKVLESAIANAENNHQLDVDRLVVAEAHVGKSFQLKRFHARGRGRSASVTKPFSHLTVIVREREDKKATKADAKNAA